MELKAKHIVYWVENDQVHGRPCIDLTEVLRLSEELRSLRRGGYSISLITSKSEYEDQIGQDGVDVTGPDYNWKKRRP